MGSVDPCDSVSQNGDSAIGSVVGSARLDPPDNMSHLFSSIATMSDVQLEAATRCMERYFDSYNEYCRNQGPLSVPMATASSTASSDTSLTSLRSIGSVSSSKIRSARRAALWRAKQVLSKPYPNGYCYARLFRDRARQSVSSELLSWPQFRLLMSQPDDLLASAVMNSDLRLVHTSVGYHVVTQSSVLQGQNSWDIYGAIAGLARRSEFPSGTIGSAARSWNTGGVSSDTLQLLSLDDKLGGTALLFREQPVPSPVFTHGNCSVVSCPSPIRDNSRFKIFLAGTDEDDGTMGWRADAANHLALVDCELLSPRYAVVDPGWECSLGYKPFADKLDWELKGLRDADVVFFNFLPGTTSSISLLELGRASIGKTVIVCCPDGYLRSANVRHFCNAYGIEWHDTFGAAVSSLVSLVESLTRPLPSPVLSPKPGKRTLAIDCEMVTASSPKFGSRSVLGRVSLVDEQGLLLLDLFVYHKDVTVVNTNHKWGSGITWKDIRPGSGAKEFDEVRALVLAMVAGKILVGHSLDSDLRVLGLLGDTSFERRDTQKLLSVIEGGGQPGLKKMAKKHLSLDIQCDKDGHSSVEDAKATMSLWQSITAGSLRDVLSAERAFRAMSFE